jgi:hypothetical protein
VSLRTSIFAASIGGKIAMVQVTGDIGVPIVPDTTPPAVPTGLVTDGSSAAYVDCAWNANVDSDLAGYKLYRAPHTTSLYVLLNTAGLLTGTTFRDPTAIQGTFYDYAVSAVDTSNNESDKCTGVQGIMDGPPPPPPPPDDPPAAVTSLVATPSQAGIALEWGDNTELDFDHYCVYYASAAAGPFTLLASPAISSYADAAAPEGEISYYRVTAVDAAGHESAPVVVAATRPVTPMQTGILISSQATMSPATVHVYATPYGGHRYFTATPRPGITLANGTPLTARYRWRFFDANGATPNGFYPELHGFNAAHLFELPAGTTTPRNFVIKMDITQPNGAVISASATIQVLPDTRRAIYVDAQGYTFGQPDTGAGTLGNPYKTLANAIAAVTGPDTAVRLARTTSTTFCYTLGAEWRLRFKNTLVEAYTPAGRDGVVAAEIQWTGTHGTNPTLIKFAGENQTVRGLQFYIQNPTFNVTANPRIFSSDSGAKNATVASCTVRQGAGSFWEQDLAPVAPPNGVLLLNNTIQPAAASIYGLGYVVGANHVLIGNSSLDYGQHGVRGAGVDNLLVAFNTLRWQRRSDNNVQNRPCFSPHVGEYCYFHRNTTSGGDLSIGPLANNGDNPGDRLRYCVFDRNTSTSILTSENGHWCGFHILHGAEFVMLRNNFVHNRDWPLVQIQGYSAQYGRGVSDVLIYNNTCWSDNIGGTGLHLQGAATRIVYRNNLFYAPVLSAGGWCARVDGNNLASFAAPAGDTQKPIDRNIWQPTILRNALPAADIFAINTGVTATLTTWNALSQVGTDLGETTVFQTQVNGVNLRPGLFSLAQSSGAPVAGVWEDYYGLVRSRTATAWASGCAEPGA